MSEYPTDVFDEIHDLQLQRTAAYGEGNGNPDAIRDKITDIANAHGYERLGSGDYRVVYGTSDHVVKVAWHQPGLRENQAEYDNWIRADGTEVVCSQNEQAYIDAVTVRQARQDGETHPARRYLGTIREVDTAYGWLVMNRVAVSGNNVSVEEAEKVRTVLADAGLQIDEIAPYNMGRTNGHPVVFDYGGV